ncbi:hypothetical protein [Rhodohalobacter sp.]|nr:hypothetical protein [Rhodohalobacter sp.]MDZ7755229.1 hypothetical protein [Rhodohalobacter sp.]
MKSNVVHNAVGMAHRDSFVYDFNMNPKHVVRVSDTLLIGQASYPPYNEL